ncbi:MAG: enoyl-CoA hydratase/isomerase family protein [Planctomycetota bacterium]
MSTFRIERERADGPTGVVVLWLEQPGKPVVVLDADLIQTLDATLDEVPADAEGLIIASAAPRAFVAGADLKSITALDDEQLHKYLEFGARVFGRLASFPFPTAAAIGAAALGGGLELAMHCDGLIGAPPASKDDGSPGKPYPVGLPEAGLMICPGWGGTNLLPARMDAERAIRATATGKPMTYDDAAGLGLFDTVAPTADALIDTARGWVREQRDPKHRDGAPSRWIGRKDVAAGVLKAVDAVRTELEGEPAEAVLAAVDTGLAKGWQAALGEERDRLVRLRSRPAGKEAIQAFFERSSGTKPAAKA